MKRVPQRTCIGCLARRPKNNLVRLVVKKRKVVVNSAGKTSGRGAYLCQKGHKVNKTCLELAIERNAFKKTFKEKIDPNHLKQNLGG